MGNWEIVARNAVRWDALFHVSWISVPSKCCYHVFWGTPVGCTVSGVSIFSFPPPPLHWDRLRALGPTWLDFSVAHRIFWMEFWTLQVDAGGICQSWYCTILCRNMCTYGEKCIFFLFFSIILFSPFFSVYYSINFVPSRFMTYFSFFNLFCFTIFLFFVVVPSLFNFVTFSLSFSYFIITFRNLLFILYFTCVIEFHHLLVFFCFLNWFSPFCRARACKGHVGSDLHLFAPYFRTCAHMHLHAWPVMRVQLAFTDVRASTDVTMVECTPDIA